MESVSKNLFKLLLIAIKYLPPILATGDALHSIASYCNHEISTIIISFISGFSLLALVFLYLLSYTFRFCEYHRLPLHYVCLSNSIALYDSIYKIPISDKLILCIYLATFGISMIFYLYYYNKYHGKIT